MSYRYTIAVVNYNMEDTLRDSLESILKQIDTDDFEVLVIDDSTDRSPQILEDLSKKWDNLRYMTGCGNENIAQARDMSFRNSSGNYIISALDADESYRNIVEDFTKIYHKIEEKKSEKFLLRGDGIYMAPKDELIEIGHRNVGYGEDRDLWRRFEIEYDLVSLNSLPVGSSIGYDRSTLGKFRVGFKTIMVQFQTGISLGSYYRWSINETLTGKTRPKNRALMHLVLCLPAWILSRRFEEKYRVSEPYNNMEYWRNLMNDKTKTLEQLSNQYGFQIERSSLSEDSREVLDLENNTPYLDF